MRYPFDHQNEAAEPLARAMISLELAREDVDNVVAPERQDEDVMASLDTDAECINHHLDNVSHWLQELANILEVDLAAVMDEYAPKAGGAT